MQRWHVHQRAQESRRLQRAQGRSDVVRNNYSSCCDFSPSACTGYFHGNSSAFQLRRSAISSTCSGTARRYVHARRQRPRHGLGECFHSRVSLPGYPLLRHHEEWQVRYRGCCKSGGRSRRPRKSLQPVSHALAPKKGPTDGAFLYGITFASLIRSASLAIPMEVDCVGVAAMNSLVTGTATAALGETPCRQRGASFQQKLFPATLCDNRPLYWPALEPK